jgi:hypothetical protein
VLTPKLIPSVAVLSPATCLPLAPPPVAQTGPLHRGQWRLNSRHRSPQQTQHQYSQSMQRELELDALYRRSAHYQLSELAAEGAESVAGT